MRTIKFFSVIVVLFVSMVSFGDDYPVGPDPVKTPGDICENSPTRRYPEGIVYCNRNVDTQLKNQIIKEYDKELGFRIGQMNRGDFKIDHFIPLSIGGSNSKKNLWPQHVSVYTVTDPLEQILSDKISKGLIKQADAIRVIREAKLNLGRVPELIDYVNSL